MEPLWSDERITHFTDNAPSAWESRRLGDAMRIMRDEYEMDRQAIGQRIDKLFDIVMSNKAMTDEIIKALGR